MARKEITIGINDGGIEKSFRIRQMAATKLEAWIAQALLLAGKTELGESPLLGKPEGQVALGMKALANISYEKAKPLYDQMLECCSVVIDGTFHELSIGNADVHIEDVKTLFKLRMEAAKLNLDFFDFEALSRSMTKMMTGAGITPTETSPA